MNAEMSKDIIETTIALLRQYHKAHYLSMIVTVSALVTMLLLTILHSATLTYWLGLFVVVVLGLAEAVYAIRVEFDIGLLLYLHKGDDDIQMALTRLDNMLLRLGIISDRSTRDLDARLQGCLRLFKRQGICAVLQVVVVIAVTGFETIITR